MKLTIVGCSGSFAGPESPASSYLVTAEAAGRTWRLVFDLGNGALGALQRHTDPADIDAVFLSHLHPDHCIDLTGLYVYRTYHPTFLPTALLPVYGPEGTSGRLHAAYEGLTDGQEMTQQFAVVDLHDGEPVEVGPFRVTPVLVNHPVEAYGFRIQADGAVLAYTGDTDSCAALGALMARADLVLADAAYVEGRDETRGVHLTGRRAAEAALAAGARRLMLTHMPAWNDPEVCRAQAAEVWPGVVELAEPNAVYELGFLGAGVGRRRLRVAVEGGPPGG